MSTDKIIDNFQDIKAGRDITIDLRTNTMSIHNKMYDLDLYSYCKNLWKDSPYFIKYEWPIATAQPFYLYDDWKLVGVSKLVHKPHNYKERDNES